MATVGTAPTSTDNADIRAEGQAAIVGRSPSEIFWSRFRRDKFAVGGLIFIIVLIALALAAPLFANYVNHHHPNQYLRLHGAQLLRPAEGPRREVLVRLRRERP